jgi:hypothetical protein
VAPKMLEALAHAIELALQVEAAVPVGGMRGLVGLRNVPHCDAEGAMRVLETQHPIVHRDKEAEAEEEERQGELNGKPSVNGNAAQANIEAEPRGEADRRGEARDDTRNGKGKGRNEHRALHDDLRQKCPPSNVLRHDRSLLKMMPYILQASMPWSTAPAAELSISLQTMAKHQHSLG